MRIFKVICLVDVAGIFFGVQIVTLPVVFGVVVTVAVFPVEWITDEAMSVAQALTTSIVYVVTDFKISQLTSVASFALSVILAINANCTVRRSLFYIFANLMPIVYVCSSHAKG